MAELIDPSLHPWVVGLLTLGMIALLLSGRFGADMVFMGVLTGLVALGIVPVEEALAGFGNKELITVALLYVVATGMQQTGAMTLLSAPLLNGARSAAGAQARLVVPVVALSAFVNNTPIVAMFLPVLRGVAKRGGFSASKLFMPLSFAAILGGVCTLIGTSTNLVVSGLLISQDVRFEGEPVRLGMWTIAWVGVPIAVCGIAYMLVFGRVLLPGRKDEEAGGGGASREYMLAMRVSRESPVVGKTIEGAGLRSLPGLFLSRIDRADATVVAVGPEEVIRAEDVLVFVGDVEGVVDLQQIRGLTPVTDEQGESGPVKRHRRQITEAVVSASSPLMGQTIREAGFRAMYGAVVLAVHRSGHRLRGKIGDIRLREGDTLLLESEPGFVDRYRDSKDFYLVSGRADAAAPNHGRSWVAMGILVSLIAAISLEWVPTVVGALLVAGTMIVTRCCTGPQARAGMDWPVLITIGAAFGLGKAMSSSGLALNVSRSILDVVGDWGPWAPLTVVYVLTLVFTAVMSNNAAAVLMLPIAVSVAGEAGANPLVFAIAVAVAASCEFSTPIGYQTNLMVMGPGQYRWLDYTRFGGPLTVLCAVIFLLVAPLAYGR